MRAENYPIWDLAADELARLAPRTEGDALIFMPGKYEIARTISAIRASRVSDQFVALPLYGELPPAEQDAALARYEKRKAIVATNVAETSLTIEGVRVVIDSGLARIARFDPRRGINTLLIEKISRASADQRAGRAGRTAPGHCLRLWTEREHLERAAQELPEVKRLDLAEVVLTLKASGVEDVANFRWLEPPDPQALERAEQLLIDLGALDPAVQAGHDHFARPPHARLSGASAICAHVPGGAGIRLRALRRADRGVHPGTQFAAPARKANRSAKIATICSAAKPIPIFSSSMRAFRFARKEQLRSAAMRAAGRECGRGARSAQLCEQFLDIARCGKAQICDETESKPGAIQRCILAGFPDQVAARLDMGTLRCALVHNRTGVLARESAVRDAPLIVASEIREIESSEKERQVLLTLATRIEEEWLRELFPEAFREEEVVEFRSDATPRDRTARNAFSRSRVAKQHRE